jgi:hypothetical protein
MCLPIQNNAKLHLVSPAIIPNAASIVLPIFSMTNPRKKPQEQMDKRCISGLKKSDASSIVTFS